MNKNSLPIVNNGDSQISEGDLVPSTRTAQEDGTRLGIFQKFKQWIQDPLGSKKKQAEIQKALETEDEQRWHEYKTQVDIIQSLIQGKQSLDDFVPNYEIEKFQRLHDELTGARIDYQSWFVQILIPLLKNPKFVSLISIIVTTLGPEHAISKWRSAVSAYITNNSEDMHDQYMSDIQDLTIKLSSTNMNDAQKKQLVFLSDIGNKTTGIQETLTQSLASFQDAISLSINHLKDFDELQAHIGTLTGYEKTVEEFLINKPPGAHLSTGRVDLLLKSLHEYRERIHAYYNQTEVEQIRRRILDQIATIHYQYQEFITKELSYYDTQKDQYQTEILRKSDQLSRIDGLTSWDYIATTTIPGLIDLRSTWIKKMSITYHTKKELVDQYYDFVDKIELKGYFTGELKSSSGFQSSIDTMRSQNITYTENTPLDQVIEVTISKMYETYIKNTLIRERNILEQIRRQFMNEIEFFQKFQHEGLSRLNSLQEAYKIQLARATNNNLGSSGNTMRTGKKIPLSTWIQSKDTTPEYDNIPNHQREEPDTVIDLLMNDIKPASWDKTFVEKPIPINTLGDLITGYCDFATQLGIKTDQDPIFILGTGTDSQPLTQDDQNKLHQIIKSWIYYHLTGQHSRSLNAGYITLSSGMKLSWSSTDDQINFHEFFSLHTLTDAHPKIKQAIESGEINVYIKQSDGSYMLGDEKLTEDAAHKLMGKESLYAITEQCDYRDGKKRTATSIFARKNTKGVDGIKRAFELQSIKQENYTNKKELTEQGLKPLFAKYKDRTEYKYLFDQPDWLSLDSNARQQLQKLVMEINLPKTGFQNSDGERRGFAKSSFLWFPLFVDGRRVYLWSNGSDAYFLYGDESVAHPVYTFTN